ncbi:MAG: alanyl-tRNA editing protein [Candidatus Hodarchaeales archaeon]|jgi:alanyl-tRNA synthetase
METRTHTALHVLKGAARKALGDDAKWTAGVRATEDSGRLTLQFNRKPTEEEIKDIENQANTIIQKNLPILIHQMTQEEARERYGDEHLDLFPIPKEIKTITVLEIPDWNTNACNRSHTNTTGEVGQIKIRKTRFRLAKQRLEISFAINQ